MLWFVKHNTHQIARWLKPAAYIKTVYMKIISPTKVADISRVWCVLRLRAGGNLSSSFPM